MSDTQLSDTQLSPIVPRPRGSGDLTGVRGLSYDYQCEQA